MAVLAECPDCHRKQGTENRKCVHCGFDMEKGKRNDRVRFWICYRLNKKQIWELIPPNPESGKNSIQDARASDGKRLSQRQEKKLTILDIKPEAKLTFHELTGWFTKQDAVKAKKYFGILKISLNKFNAVFGDREVESIKYNDLVNYQARRKAAGKAASTIDQEIGAAKGMVNFGFLSDKIGGDALRPFKAVKKLLENKNANARKRVLTCEEYESLFEASSPHFRPILATGYLTGMREGELLSLTWDRVSLQEKVIRLKAENTKDAEARVVPIGNILFPILESQSACIPKDPTENHVFLYYGTPLSDIREAVRQACDRAKIPYGRFVDQGFIFHDLRHTFVTNMRKAGVHNAVTNSITGHSMGTMRDRYDTVDLDDLRQGIKKLEGFLQSVNKSVNKNPQETEKGMDSNSANPLNSSIFLSNHGAEGGT
jgi:integrase